MALVWKLKPHVHENGCREKVKQSLKWFQVATLLQFGVGSWWLLALPRHFVRIFMGGSTWATAFFALGLLGTILSLIFGYKARVRLCAGATLITILCMVLMRDALRTAMLEPYFSLAMLEIDPQYGSLVLFIGFLGLGSAAIVYMLKLAFRKNQEVGS
jgi:hypothetical protein